MASSCGSIDGLTWLCFLETVGGETDYGSAFALERYVKGKGMIWVFLRLATIVLQMLVREYLHSFQFKN